VFVRLNVRNEKRRKLVGGKRPVERAARKKSAKRRNVVRAVVADGGNPSGKRRSFTRRKLKEPCSLPNRWKLFSARLSRRCLRGKGVSRR
jgi:hypothetical protein